METKKLIRRVSVQITPSEFSLYEVGREDVVAIMYENMGVKVYFRAKDEKSENSTPRKMEDRPMKYFSGFTFIVEDVLI